MQQTGLMQAIAQTRAYARMTHAAQEALQQKRLIALVRYARQNSPYFARLYDGLPEDAPISVLPPTDKRALMAHFDDWITDRAVTSAKVTRFMENLDNVGRKLGGKYLVFTTSGSTGDPAVVLYDDTMMNVSSAIGICRTFARKQDMRAFLSGGGRSMGLFADNGFYLGCGSIRYNLRRMPWKKRQLMPFDVRNPLPEIVDALNRFQPCMLGSYPTALELLIDEQRSGRLHIAPVLIMTGGEQLRDEVRTALSDAFSCYVQTNYSCTEGGTMACECTEHHFHINTDRVLLEPVDAQNRPVPPGVRSDKLLLTNLSSYVQPFIRYEITDRVTLYDAPCPCGNPLPYLTIEGRTDDILKFGETRVAPLALYALLKEAPGVRRFQLVEHADESLELRLVADDRAAAFAHAEAALNAYFLQNGVRPRIVLGDGAPQTDPASGKFRHVLRLRA